MHAKVRKILKTSDKNQRFYLPISEKSRNFAHMIEFDRHIEILLLSNDCVIVPDFGGFMAHHVDARYDEADHTFLPPLRSLGFNPQLKMNDSLLAQSYVEAYDISYPEAVRRLEGEVAELRQHLETTGSYELNDLGTLRLNEEGSIVFEPCEAGILTPGLYGLSSFEMKPLAQVEKTAIVVPIEASETISEAVEEPNIIIKMSWLRNVVAVAAAVIAFFMIGTPISNSDIQQSSFIHIGSTPTATTGTVSTSASDSKNAVSTNTSATNAEEAASTAQTTYTLVLASQVSEKNACIFMNTLAKGGFNDARILKTTMTRVVYGSYTSESEAYNAQQQLRKQSRHFREAWVMKVTTE